MRGERLVGAGGHHLAAGSSPHARGTPDGLRSYSKPLRFIPACAGNADAALLDQDRRSVHPRMRGERHGPPETACPCDGSSPHARGTRLHRPTRGSATRFIPACAGNAGSCGTGFSGPSVHPRMRGERTVDADVLCRRAGSSPHARGTPTHKHAAAANPRFIPACAGNAANGPSSRVVIAVHPRMRGERGPTGPRSPVSPGSSPHARGTHVRPPV